MTTIRMHLGASRTLGDDAGIRLRAICLSILLLTSLLSVGGVGGVAAQTDTCEVIVGTGESVQDAIDAAQSGDTVCVETGTYGEQLTIDVDGTTLVAADGHSPVLSGSGSGTGVTIDDASNVTVEGFAIRGYATAVRVDGSPNATLRSNTITENDQAIRDFDTASHGMLIIDNVIEQNPIRGITIQGSDDVQITGNRIEANGNSASGPGYGIYIRGGSGGERVTIEDNTIANQDGGVSIWTPGSVVRDNAISGHTVFGINLRTGLGSQNAHDAVIEHNAFDNTGTSVQARSVQNPALRNNSFAGSGTDIDFEFVSTAVLSDNELTTGLLLEGGSLTHFSHDVAGNTINSDPFVYVNGADSPVIPTDAGQIIVVDSTNVTVSGFELDGIAAGIQVAHSPSAVVADNTVTNTTGSGIRLWSSGGAVVENNVVTRTVIGSDTQDPAIGVSGSSGVTVATNDITETDGRALRVTSSPNAEIRENTLSDNYGGLFLSTSDDATVANNTISGTHHGGGNVGNLRAAILVTSGERIQFTGNHIHDNAGNGVHDNRGQNARDAVMTDNVITNNGKDGIYWRDARDATFTNNTVSNNGGIGIRGPYGATVTENTIEHNAGAGIDVSHESTVEANVVHDNGGNGVMVNRNSAVRDNTISDSGGSGISLRYYGDQLIENNDVSGHDADLVIFETEAVTVRDNTFETGVLLVSSANPYSTLTEDLTTHSFSGNTVAGKELYYVTDANNPSIPADPGQVIISNSTSVTVSGLEFDGVTAPIQIAFSEATVTNTTVANSTGSIIQRVGAITLWASDDSLVADNVVTASANDGLRVVESDGVNLKRNAVADNERNGIRLEGATNTTITDETISNVGSHGLLAERSAGLTLNGVTVENSGLDGLTIERSDGTTIVQSTVIGSDRRGIYLESGDGAVLKNNTVTTSGESGIESGTGFRSADDASITGNTVTDNSDVGIHFGGSDGIEISSNNVSENSIGITVTSDAVVTDNQVTNNLEIGIEIVFRPVGMLVTDNEIVDNGIGVDYDRGSWSGYEAVNAAQNWWGDESGPSGGVVDPVTGTVADGSGDSVTENVRFDPWLTTDPTDGSDPAAGQFDVEITGTNEPVTAGESLVVTATITNAGDEETTETIELRNGATVLDAVDVTLDTGANDSIPFTWETAGDDIGVFDLSVVSPSDSDTVTVTVDAPSSGAFFTVSIDDTNEPIESGKTLEVSATIANTGDAEDTQTVDLVAFDGTTVVDSTSLTLAAEATESITLQWTDAPEGTGDVTVRTEDDDETRTVAIGGDAAVEITGCRVIDTSGSYALSGDLSGDDTCITITASDVTFDGGGHTIAASNATGGDWGIHAIGVDERIENVTVTNVVLEGWDNGVRFRNVDDGELSNAVVENGSTGVLLSASHGNELTDLTIRDNDRRGLSLSSSSGNVVSGVDATGNEASTTFGGRGSVYLFGSSNNAFEDVSVADGRSGVRVSFSSGNEFTGVTTERHANYGLEVESNSNTFTDVVANDNGWHGIQVNTASFNAFENVSVTGTDGSAVRLTGIGSGSPPQSNVFENVSVTDNDGAAISLSVANYNTFRDVTAAVNTGTAISFDSRAEGNLVEFGDVDHGSSTAVNFGPDSVGNTIREVSLSGTGTPFAARDGAPNNEFDRVDVGGTVVSLSARSVGSFRTSPSTLPADATPLGSYLGLTPHSAGTTHVEHLRFHYEAADVESLDESALAIWRLSGGEWTAPTDATYVTGVDTDQQYVFATGIDESHLSATFGAFAAGDPTDPGDDGGSGDDDGSSGSGSGGSSGGGGSGGSGTSSPVAPEPEPDTPFFTVNIVETTSPVTAGETLDVTAVVENAGGENGTGPVELAVDGVVADSTSLSLSSGDEAALSLSWTTTADDVGETIAIEVRTDDDAVTAVVTVEPVDETADIVLYNARAQTDTVDVGETLTVVGDFYNLGTTGGERTVTLFVAGEPVDDATVTVSPGLARNAVQLTWTPSESDIPQGAATTDVTVSLDGLLVGTVTVENPYSEIRVIAASTSSTDLVAGEEAYVIGSIYQAGTIAGSETFDLVAENVDTGEEITLGSQERELAPGYYHLGALNVSYTIHEAGTYDLRLGDRAAGTVEVEAAASDIQVIAAGTSAVELFAGEEAYAIGSIYQAGTIAGSETVELVAENVDTGEEVVIGSQESPELSPGWYYLGALNVSYTIDEPGTYDLRLGDRSAGTVVVDPGTVDIDIVSVEGQGTGFDVETDEQLVYASHTATVDVDVDSDAPLDEVTLLVSSQATTFAVTAPGTYVANDRWTFDVPLDDIPDDGRYDLTVVAVDAAGTGNAANADEVLVIDRSLPSVSVSIGSGLLDAATVTVTSDVPLADVPAVEAAFIDADGAIRSTTVTMDEPGPDETRYTGTIHAADSGTYAVTVVATDRAGNEAAAEASAHITRRFTLADGPVTFDRHGSAVEFHLAEDADQAIAEQELFGSFTAYDGHHDVGGALGVGFLTADLDPFLDHQLEAGGVESATVSIAVDETALGDASADEVVIQHYEPATGSWTPVETTHGTVDGALLVSAEVTHFSTYGAFLVDETPPTVLDVTPADGATVTVEDDAATVAFTYEDDRSGVDVSSVSIEIDGTDVTSADGTTITSAHAEHTFAAMAGETYEATLTLADRVGNERTQTVTFSVAADHDADTVAPPDEGSWPEATGSVGGLVLLLIALVIAALLGTVAYRRRDR